MCVSITNIFVNFQPVAHRNVCYQVAPQYVTECIDDVYLQEVINENVEKEKYKQFQGHYDIVTHEILPVNIDVPVKYLGPIKEDYLEWKGESQSYNVDPIHFTNYINNTDILKYIKEV